MGVVTLEEYNIDNLYLPLTATKNRLVAVFIISNEVEAELEIMVKAIIGGLRGCGFYTDALAFGFTYTDHTLEIFIKEPVFDVFNHLHSC
jgi:hypothetical protein